MVTNATTAIRCGRTCAIAAPLRNSTKRSHKVQYSVDGRLYALRVRIEFFFNKLKDNRCIATRDDQTSTSFLGLVLLGCIRIRIRCVHAA